MLPEFLKPVGNSKAMVEWIPPKNFQTLPVGTDITDGWDIDRSVPPVDLFSGGTDEALKHLKKFTERHLAGYENDRNKPEMNATSLLSPYLHFGHLGPHTVALAIQEADLPVAAKDAYLEQLIVRRELAINFVHLILIMTTLKAVLTGRTRHWPNMQAIPAGSTRKKKWKKPVQMMPCGMRLSSRCFMPAGCTTTCACTGPRKFWSGVNLPQRLSVCRLPQ